MRKAPNQAELVHGFIFEMKHKLTGECRYIRAVPEEPTIEKGEPVENFEPRLVKSKAKATRFPTAEIASLATGSLSLIGTKNLDFSVLEV